MANSVKSIVYHFFIGHHQTAALSHKKGYIRVSQSISAIRLFKSDKDNRS